MQFEVLFKQTEQRFGISFEQTNQSIPVLFQHYQAVGGTCLHESYDGSYEVTPAVTAQTLATKQKVMDEDLKIKEIPYFDVSNLAGGSTVYIGREIE